MKTNIKKFLCWFIVLLLNFQIVLSQNELHQWVSGFGINVVDIRKPTQIFPIIEDYVGVDDANLYGLPLRFMLGSYIDKGFSVHVSGSFNTIKKTKFYTAGMPLEDLNFWAIDAKGTYDINRLIGATGWFDPYLLAGGGYAKIGAKSNATLAAGYGFYAWINSNVGIQFQSDYNHSFKLTETDYFQHSVGIVYRFNTRVKFEWAEEN